jgi:type II restriction/modification system DNA methylase subunit YeeA
MVSFRNMDAVLDLTDPANPREPEWPAADYIVGNPPFLGGKRLRTELGNEYVDHLFHVYRGRVPAEADLVAYWFEKGREQVEKGECGRTGFLATQGIRGGANREVLKRIKESGDIFFAEGDRDWVLDGASVHVSMIGFDNGAERERVLDGGVVASINANLTSAADTTRAGALGENKGVAFQGPVKVGKFEIDEQAALNFLSSPNPHGKPNSDVLLRWFNGMDITRRPRGFWIIDFGSLSLEEASMYEGPFRYVERVIKPERVKNADRQRREFWWRLGRSGGDWKLKAQQLTRTIFTPRVSKHRLFVWFDGSTLPDTQVVAFARDDDYTFGVLHSRFHEVWALAQGTQVREKESGFRYTPTTCFETFPFPRPTPEQGQAISAAARDLNELRARWLNPPEWTREEILEFPGTVDGPWARYVSDVDERGVGVVRYARSVPRDEAAAQELSKRTLTNLYNQRPAWLVIANEKLDAAVAAAYGWEPSLPDGQILERLLRMNLERRG